MNQSLSFMNIDDSRSLSTIESYTELLIDTDDDDDNNDDDPGWCYDGPSSESTLPSCIENQLILSNANISGVIGI